MIRLLTSLVSYETIEEIRKEWLQAYEEARKEEPELTFEDFANSNYYASKDNEYFYDDRSGMVCKASEFFHDHIRG